ncbi:transglutaminase domain-containing protein [Paraflavitalea speifideaquila]|uniref:transglutaminase domain-containing protein n=1 Tax=Paraflavitalea speifideaquila TaxID=3076558 RepID=UPI0028EA78BE|nr:transglutaminase domain-containing protein [Paraflavitalea speifideiaquila]
MTAQGACGSHAYVLARLLREMNVDVRIPQMTVKGQSAGHIIVEAKASYGWVVLDPLSNVYFRRLNGQLAGFNDVKNNWSYYQQQLPANYNMAYRYEGARYTNWDKIPVVMPLIKNIMYWTMGKEKQIIILFGVWA